jgi:hypothetical protein
MYNTSKNTDVPFVTGTSVSFGESETCSESTGTSISLGSCSKGYSGDRGKTLSVSYSCSETTSRCGSPLDGISHGWHDGDGNSGITRPTEYGYEYRETHINKNGDKPKEAQLSFVTAVQTKTSFLLAADTRNTALWKTKDNREGRSYSDGFLKIGQVSDMPILIASTGKNLFDGETVPEIAKDFVLPQKTDADVRSVATCLSGLLASRTEVVEEVFILVVGFDNSGGKGFLCEIKNGKESIEEWDRERFPRMRFIGEPWATEISKSVPPELFCGEGGPEALRSYIQTIIALDHFLGKGGIGGDVQVVKVTKDGVFEF